MSGPIARLASRRINRDRRLAFGVCAALLVVSAGLLLSLPDQAPLELEGPVASPRAVAPKRLESSAPRLEQPRRAARRFLGGYLALVTGRGSVASIPAASPALAARLKSPLRVPPASRSRRPKLAGLSSRQIGPELVAVTATITTAGISFSLALTVARQQGRWLVVEVTEAS